VVVTTGTFLNGLIYVGMESFPGGRLGDPTPRGLSESLAAHGLTIGRLKTGTPARLLARSIDLSGLQAQPPDPIQHPFSHEGPGFVLPQVRCYGARTNPKTHEIIRQALDRSPLYCGVIKGRGPRYCPSIEDKVVRFPDRQSHTVVLEPMDSTQEVLYPNGISTSLPRDVQDRFIHSIEGLERAEVLHHGYAIEYDFVLPTQLKPSLEVKKVPGLFLAGQINGTSGYEEAAGQGLIAGINAAATVRRRAPVTLGRHEAYLGVLIDDLVTRGTEEPYRMFSSRVEYRLLLREDNAATRMQSWAKAVGLVPPEVLARREEQQRQLQRLVALLRDTRVAPEADGHRPSLQEMLRRPEVTIRDLERHLPEEASIDVLEQAEVQIKYQGYIEREVQQVERLKKSESQRIPEDMPYETISGLTRELSEKLMKIRPETLGQAGRIDGMTPAALMLLSIWINKQLRVPRGTKVGKD
jgi:tRNA uridine 5-carboxymethylaminomethyl modification enzyme